MTKYDIRFDVNATEPPYFWVANAAIRKASRTRYVPVREVLVLDTEKEKDQRSLQELAKRVKVEGFCDGMDAMEVYTKLDRVRKIRDKDVVVITIGHELEDVVEVFSRLNSRGTRVTEADIYLGVVAARNPGWVRETFLPYLKVLGDAGFAVDPNLLFRTMTGVGIKKVRFRDISDEFWEADKIKPAWDRTADAWKRLIARFKEFGILSSDPMPTQAALVPLVAMVDKYGDDKDIFALLLVFPSLVKCNTGHIHHDVDSHGRDSDLQDHGFITKVLWTDAFQRRSKLAQGFVNLVRVISVRADPKIQIFCKTRRRVEHDGIGPYDQVSDFIIVQQPEQFFVIGADFHAFLSFSVIRES